MIVSLELKGIHDGLTASGIVRLDPGRIASYAVAGIGFLGAGAIIHGRGSVQGLTTAACLWAANGIGLAVGAGLIMPAVATTAVVLTALILLQPLVSVLPRDTYWRIYLDFDTCGDKIPEIRALLTEYKVRVIHTGFECRYDAASSSYEVAIRVKSTQDLMEIFGGLRRLEGLVKLRWAEGFVP
jgi:putative Mg2+ transporter-C (MgtC) family protein